ncbi:properdin-like [Pseudophryne corroboree]|uniref:properdin-like n=1 Tax=Pseudophryne corroboree TaxID=495146 RepID=UPI003081F24D
MVPVLLLVKIAFGALLGLQLPGSDAVQCYSQVNSVSGECERYLGDGVSDEDCCLNINYGYKKDGNSACQACREAEWSQWSEWSPCTVSCLEGIQSRNRVCIGKGDCPGHKEEVQICSLQDCCPVMGGWSPWSPWSQCSVTCGLGQMKRTRECNNPAPECGGLCVGNREETTVCDTNQVCPTHGAWSNWGNWGDCSSTCMAEDSKVLPTQSRHRLCNSPSPSVSPPGRSCEGNKQETRDCAGTPFCPVDGGWGPWVKASECSVTCGIGNNKEERSCNNPAPRHGGNRCPESTTRYVICNTKQPCPIDGRWGPWTDWKPCADIDTTVNINCKTIVGLQSRTRRCIEPQHNGADCKGSYRDSRRCYDVEGCFLSKGEIEANWSEWSNWGLCSSPCGASKTKRYRECLVNYPGYKTKISGITKELDVYFSGTPKFRCSKLNGQFLKVEEERDCKNVPACT